MSLDTIQQSVEYNLFTIPRNSNLKITNVPNALPTNFPYKEQVTDDAVRQSPARMSILKIVNERILDDSHSKCDSGELQEAY
jgi:hypothetical protein